MSRAVEKLITPKATAEMLGIPLATLYQWRTRGEGPPSIKLGARHVRYRPSEVLGWIREHEEVRP